MSANRVGTQESLHRFGPVVDEHPGNDLEPTDLLWLSTLTLPISAALDFDCCPTAVWSEDRGQCVLNRAATALLGPPSSDMASDRWLACIDPTDRERFLAAWQGLVSNGRKMVCSYRFMSRAPVSPVEIEETALRLPGGLAAKAAVLSRYQTRDSHNPRARTPVRRLVHQIGNSLQSVRGEVDLLRLFGALPQQSFDTIVRAIESIRELAALLDEADRATPGAANTQSAGNGAGWRCADEVRRGRT